MNKPPSKKLLRYLARACHEVPLTALTRPQCISTRAIARPVLYEGQRLKPPFTPRATRYYATASTASESSATSTSSDTTNTHPPPPPSPPHSQPDISTHYTLFPTTLPHGPPPSGPFDIPTSKLRREFLQLQGLHHPDKSPVGTAQHKSSLGLSSLLNNAYRTLSDPLLRAQYLLHLHYGIDVMSEDNSSHPTDQSTLMDVLEAQEAIEEAGGQDDIDRLKDENRLRIDETAEKMGKAFEADDGETAKDECVRLKYWRSLQDGLNDWEPGKEVRLIH